MVSSIQELSFRSTPSAIMSIGVIRLSLSTGLPSGTTFNRRPLCVNHTSRPSSAWFTSENISLRNWVIGTSMDVLYHMYIYKCTQRT